MGVCAFETIRNPDSISHVGSHDFVFNHSRLGVDMHTLACEPPSRLQPMCYVRLQPDTSARATMSRMRTGNMIRRTIIVLLLGASIGVVYIFTTSFSEKKTTHRMAFKIGDSLVMASVFRGSAIVLVGSEANKFSWPPSHPDYEDFMEFEREFRRLREDDLQEKVLRQPAFENDSCITRFGYASSIQVPLPSKRRPTAKRPLKTKVFPMGYVVFPLWCLFVGIAAIPASMLIIGPLRRRSRRKRNKCVQCGYDLTGLRERRCPECGEPA